jgi:hypothetical protein
LICTDSLLLQNTANYHKHEWQYWGYKHGKYNHRVNEGRLNMHKSWSTIKSSTLIVYYIFTFNRISGIVFSVLVSTFYACRTPGPGFSSLYALIGWMVWMKQNYHKYEWQYWGYKHGKYNHRVNEGRLNMHKSWSTIKSSTLIVYYIFTFNRIFNEMMKSALF